jgi:putative transposase
MASFPPSGADRIADELRHLGQRQGPTPRTPKYARAQIIEILKAARDGALIKDLCREYGITDSTFYRWRTRYAQALSAAAPAPGTPEQQLRHVEAENRRLRRLLASAERLSA